MSAQPLQISAEAKATLPQHVAIIMDGNGRWAEARHLARIEGHRAGSESVDHVISAASELGIEALTLFAFSTENWKRSVDEVNLLMAMLLDALDEKLPKLQENNVRFYVIGQRDKLPSAIQERILRNENLTRNNTGLNLVLATPWGSKFLPELSDYLRYLNAYHPQISFFNMPVSHDSGSALQEFAHAEYAKLRYFVTLFAASPYSGMVQGYEYVLDRKLEFIDVKTSMEFKKSPRNISDFIKHCHKLMDAHPVLSAKALKIANTDSVLAVLKTDLEHDVLILLNMNIHQNAVIPFELPEKFAQAKEVFGTSIQRKLKGGLNEISLVPGEMAIYLV
jgi:hypothetical protein